MPSGKNVLVVMPAYNAARTLANTWARIPLEYVDHILLVDDGSQDDTVAVASGLPDVRTIVLPHNVGYGGNQKVCYLEALRMKADVVILLHPDGQYDPEMIPDLIGPILGDEADMVLGSRMLIPGAAPIRGEQGADCTRKPGSEDQVLRIAYRLSSLFDLVS
jgi:glycosyltransferase involved in cell wall biosynthesis